MLKGPGRSERTYDVSPPCSLSLFISTQVENNDVARIAKRGVGRLQEIFFIVSLRQNWVVSPRHEVTSHNWDGLALHAVLLLSPRSTSQITIFTLFRPKDDLRSLCRCPGALRLNLDRFRVSQSLVSQMTATIVNIVDNNRTIFDLPSLSWVSHRSEFLSSYCCSHSQRPQECRPWCSSYRSLRPSGFPVDDIYSLEARGELQ